MGHHADRRQFERTKIDKPTKIFINGEHEAAAQLVDISKGGLFIETDAQAQPGDDIVVYPDGLGRLAGKVVQRRNGGIAVMFEMSDAYREFLEKRISAAVEGKPYLRIAERRSYRRVEVDVDATLQLVDTGQSLKCRINDISQSGASIKTENRPPIGARISFASIMGKVLRHTPDGFSVVFLQADAA